MDNLKLKFEQELSFILEKMPERNNKSALGKQKRLSYYIENQELFGKKLNQIANEFIQSNVLSETELNQLKILSNEYYQAFSKNV